MKKHHTVRRFTAWFLAVVMAASLIGIPVSAEKGRPTSGMEYPTVFVHGLFGWGEEDGLSDFLPYFGLASGDFCAYLRDQGLTVYSASVGPVSSVHDRCCELFAQLTGTRVDFGQAHADKVTAEFDALGSTLKHSRYGRDYTGKAKIEGWGPIFDEGQVTGWHDNKINLVGHSFGGATALEFISLLAKGDPDEIAWAKAQSAKLGGDWHSYISPLFWGDYDGQFLVNSMTSIAGVLNGTTFMTANKDVLEIIMPAVSLAAGLTGKTDNSLLYDFRLDQFGITNLPGSTVSDRYAALETLGFTEASDNAFYDLSTAGTNLLKTDWNTYDNIYYFSYACDKTHADGGVRKPDPDMFLVFQRVSGVMGSYQSDSELITNVDGSLYGSINAEWQKNDGMVSTISSRYPLGAPHKEYDANAVESGVWNVHPDMDEDHISIIGDLPVPKPLTTKSFFDGVLADIRCTVPVFDGNRMTVAAHYEKMPAPVISLASPTLLGNALLNWDSVGSCCYEVYRSDTENGDYTRVGVTLLSAFTDLTVRSGKTYFYKIVAVPLSSSHARSDFSFPVSVKID